MAGVGDSSVTSDVATVTGTKSGFHSMPYVRPKFDRKNFLKWSKGSVARIVDRSGTRYEFGYVER